MIPSHPFKILFVCTGNICRSPMAEAVARHKAIQMGMEDRIQIASCGTHDYHIGERPDPRTLKILHQKGISDEGLFASKISQADFMAYDLIWGMDQGHVDFLRKICPDSHVNKISLFLGNKDVPDPYYGGFSDFEHVFALVDEGTDNLAKFLNLKK